MGISRSDPNEIFLHLAYLNPLVKSFPKRYDTSRGLLIQPSMASASVWMGKKLKRRQKEQEQEEQKKLKHQEKLKELEEKRNKERSPTSSEKELVIAENWKNKSSKLPAQHFVDPTAFLTLDKVTILKKKRDVKPEEKVKKIKKSKEKVVASMGEFNRDAQGRTGVNPINLKAQIDSYLGWEPVFVESIKSGVLQTDRRSDDNQKVVADSEGESGQNLESVLHLELQKLKAENKQLKEKLAKETEFSFELQKMFQNEKKKWEKEIRLLKQRLPPSIPKLPLSAPGGVSIEQQVRNLC